MVWLPPKLVKETLRNASAVIITRQREQYAATHYQSFDDLDRSTTSERISCNLLQYKKATVNAGLLLEREADGAIKRLEKKHFPDGTNREVIVSYTPKPIAWPRTGGVMKLFSRLYTPVTETCTTWHLHPNAGNPLYLASNGKVYVDRASLRYDTNGQAYWGLHEIHMGDLASERYLPYYVRNCFDDIDTVIANVEATTEHLIQALRAV